jgi:large subunit ribosomal protein L10
MPLTKTKKKEILDKVKDVTDSAKSIVFVNFHGVTVGDSTAMRKGLRDAGVKYIVAKKTLARKALDAKKILGTMPELSGELAFAYGEDLIAPAREVRTFEKKFEGKVSILGGVFEGKYMSKEEMTAIALIPSQKVLYGMFVNLINSPIQRFVIAVDQIGKTKK